jgi:hypothetical protein
MVLPPFIPSLALLQNKKGRVINTATLHKKAAGGSVCPRL